MSDNSRSAELGRRGRCSLRHFLVAVLILLFGRTLFAAEVIPPAPDHYFNDYAGVVDASTAQQLNSQLEQFEKDTSSQIVVAVYPKMQSDSDIADYTVRVARAWRVGQKATNNGVVLFVFIQDRKMWIQTGYGQEGPLTDILCQQIIDNEIKPRFKQGDYTGGLTAGVKAMMAATRGEYKGTGSTHAENQNSLPGWAVILIIIFFLLIFIFGKRTGTGYSSRGFGTGFMLGGMSGGFGGGGGGGGFSGGGFSGGGGSFGGGGAGGGW